MSLAVNDENSTNVLNTELPVILDLSASWCGPCKALAPIVDEIAEEHEQLHHDGANGKRPVAILRRQRREAHIHHHEAEGADEEVAVEDKQPADLLPAKSGRKKLKIEGCGKARAEWSWLRFCRA